MTSFTDKPAVTIKDWWPMAVAETDTDVVARRERLDACRESIRRRLLPFQGALLANAESQIANLKRRNKHFQELSQSYDSVVERIEAGEAVSFEEWHKLENRSNLALAVVGPAVPRAEKLAESLLDPLSALDELEQRQPPLRRPPFST